MSSQMTQQDWENLHQEWLESFRTSHTTPGEFKHQYQYEPKVDTTGYKFLRKIGRGTPKAQFFLTEDGIAGDFGFWCPKSAIVSVSEDEVKVASWCKIKVIEYNRY